MTGWRLGYGVWPEALFAACRAAGDQLPFLRQRRGAIRRHRRADRAARAGRAHGRGLCRAPRDDRRGAERPARVSLRQSGRRLLRLPQRRRAPGSTPARCRRGCSTRPASRPSPAPASAHSARAICGFPTPTAARRSPRRSSASAGSWAIWRCPTDRRRHRCVD